MSMKLVKYPAHSDDFCLVTSKRGLDLLHTICRKYGTAGEANCYVFHDVPQVQRSIEYADWIDENIKVRQAIVSGLYPTKMDPVISPELSDLLCLDLQGGASDEGLMIGIELASEPLMSWQIGAILAILERELDFKVRELKYGGSDHHVWLSFVQD